MFVGRHRHVVAPFNGYDAATYALLEKMSVKPSRERARLIDATIKKLKRHGIWYKLDVLYVMAAHASQAANLNWKNPGTHTLTAIGGGATFTADRGYQGNGSSTAMSCGYVPSTNGVSFTQDDASIWCWNNLDQQDAQPSVGRVASIGYHILGRNASNNMGGRLNDNDVTTRANSNGIGLFGISRPAAGTKRYWRNGAQVGTDISGASTGVSTVASFAAGGGAATAWEDNQTALYALGAALSGLESSFDEICRTYMQGVGNA